MPSAISVGPAFTMLQNVTYALPAKRVLARVSAAIETSLDGSTWNAVTLTNNQAELAAIFVRGTTANTLITLKVL